MTEPNDLIIRLSHGLSVALEMSYSSEELRFLWQDELDALDDAKSALALQGLPAPPAVTSVLRLARRNERGGCLPEA